MTAALEGAEWSATSPGRTLPPGKTRYPLYRRLGGPQSRSGRARNLVPTGIRSRMARRVTTAYCPQYSNVFRSDSYKKQVLFPYTALGGLSNESTQCSLWGTKLTLSYHADNFDQDRLETKTVLVTACSKMTWNSSSRIIKYNFTVGEITGLV